MAKRRRPAQVDRAVQEQFEPKDVVAAPSATLGAYRAYKPPVDLEHAAELPPGNLRTEIAVVRSVLADLLKMDLAPEQRALSISQLMAALVRLVRENRFVDGTQADQIEQITEDLLQDKHVGMAAAQADTPPTNGGASGSNDR